MYVYTCICICMHTCMYVYVYIDTCIHVSGYNYYSSSSSSSSKQKKKYPDDVGSALAPKRQPGGYNKRVIFALHKSLAPRYFLLHSGKKKERDKRVIFFMMHHIIIDRITSSPHITSSRHATSSHHYHTSRHHRTPHHHHASHHHQRISPTLQARSSTSSNVSLTPVFTTVFTTHRRCRRAAARHQMCPSLTSAEELARRSNVREQKGNRGKERNRSSRKSLNPKP